MKRKRGPTELLIQSSAGGLLGSGAYGTVRRGTLSGVPVAVKRFSGGGSSFEPRQGVLREIMGLLVPPPHPNLVSVQAVLKDEGKSGKLNLVMPLYGPCLTTVISKSLPDADTILKWCGELASSVAHLHDSEVLHRDIKLENLVLMDTKKNASIVLLDLGMSRCLPTVCPPMCTSLVCTLCTRPPETIEKAISTLSHTYGKETDVWSMGMTMLAIAAGDYVAWSNKSSGEHERELDFLAMLKNLFNENNAKVSIRKFIKRNDLHPSIFSAIEACLVLVPGGRSTAREVCAMFGSDGAGKKGEEVTSFMEDSDDQILFLHNLSFASDAGYVHDWATPSLMQSFKTWLCSAILNQRGMSWWVFFDALWLFEEFLKVTPSIPKGQELVVLAACACLQAKVHTCFPPATSAWAKLVSSKIKAEAVSMWELRVLKACRFRIVPPHPARVLLHFENLVTENLEGIVRTYCCAALDK